MRFFHKDFAPIAAWLASQPHDIRLLQWDLEPAPRGPLAFFAGGGKSRQRAHPPRPSSAAEVAEIYERSQRADQAGLVLSVYFHLNAPPTTRAVSLPAAVEHVEAFAGPDEILLVGHPDGGLVSVSRTFLPFQEGADEARGWGP